MKVSNFKLGIGDPCNFPMVPVGFHDSFTLMDKPEGWVYIPIRSGRIDEMRNYIVDKAFMHGCSHVLMLDADQTYEKETVQKLLRHNLPIVHCRVYRRYPPFDSLMYNLVAGVMVEKTGYETGDLVEVDISGMGGVLYSMEVFQKLQPPWFQELRTNSGVTGEDFAFCDKARKAGYKIYVDTSIRVGHLGTLEVDEAFHDLYQALIRRQQELSGNVQVNTKNMNNA